MAHTVSRTNLARSRLARYEWRQATEEWVKPMVEEHIKETKEMNEAAAINEEPYAPDVVDRGMIILRKIKF